MDTFALAFFLASFWATVGCLLVHLLFSAKFNLLLVFWLMTVFAFTFVNQIIILEKLEFPVSVLFSGVGLITPMIAHFGYRRNSNVSPKVEKVSMIIFGGMLIGASSVCAFAAGTIVMQLRVLDSSGRSDASTMMILFFLAFLGMGFSGLIVSLRARSA